MEIGFGRRWSDNEPKEIEIDNPTFVFNLAGVCLVHLTYFLYHGKRGMFLSG